MPTEYRFFCPELRREVSTAECYDRGNTGRACYGECCQHVEQAILTIAQTRLKARFGEQITTEYRADDSMLVIRFHAHLTLEAHYDPLQRTIAFDAYLGVTHGHQFPAGDVDGLVRLVGQLLNGAAAFVVQPNGLLPGALRLVSRDELVANWRKYTRGRRTKIIDGRGMLEKEKSGYRPS